MNQSILLDFCTRGRYNSVTNLIGAVAQLGERLTGSQEVTGSNPVGSILHTKWRC
jgi:hypothetical protein